MDAFLVLTGLLLFASPGGTIFLVWMAWRRHRRINSTIRFMTCEQLSRAGTLPRWAAVSGRTVAMGENPLRAPRSGAACAWFQIEYARSPNDDDHLQRWVQLPDGAELVAITDGSATVFLTPELARTKLSGPSIATISATGHDGDTGWQEVIIAPEVPVFVIGRPVRARDLGRIMTRIVEKGPAFLPHAGFPMTTSAHPSPEQDGVVLLTGWRSPYGVTTFPAEQIRGDYSARLWWILALLLGLPVLGFGLIALAAALRPNS